MSHIGTSPPSGVKLSCIAFTEPFEAAVVAVAQSADDATPKRTSLPSMLPGRSGRLRAAARSGLPRCSADAQSSEGRHHDARSSPRTAPSRAAADFTMAPKVKQSAAGMSRIASSSTKLRERRRVLERDGPSSR